jgi:hypothetical protein
MINIKFFRCSYTHYGFTPKERAGLRSTLEHRLALAETMFAAPSIGQRALTYCPYQPLMLGTDR